MAYPPNRPPATPGVLYDAVDTGNDPLFVELKGQIYAVVIGAQSRARIDMPYYSGATDRDDVDASLIGRAPMSVIQYKNVGGSSTPLVTGNGDLFVVDANAATTSFTPAPDEVATMMQQDDNFTHTPPHQKILAQSLIRYYDGPVVSTLPTGKVVGEFPVDQWRGECSRIPQNNGATPPVFTP